MTNANGGVRMQNATAFTSNQSSVNKYAARGDDTNAIVSKVKVNGMMAVAWLKGNRKDQKDHGRYLYKTRLGERMLSLNSNDGEP